MNALNAMHNSGVVGRESVFSCCETSILDRVKFLVRVLLILSALAMTALVAAVLAFNAGLFHDFIQKEARAALGPGASVHLGPMQLQYRWPLLIRVGPSVVDMAAANVQWQNLEVEALKVTTPYALSLNFNQLHVIVRSSEPTPATKISAAPVGGGGTKPLPLSIKVQVVNGEIKSDYADLAQLNLKFEQKLLLKTPASVHLTAGLKLKFFPIELPLQIDTDKLTFSAQAVKTSDLKVSLGGLVSAVQGTSLLDEGRHRWLIEVVAKDLAQLPQPPMAHVPAKNWRGEVQFKAEVNKASAAQGWGAEGSFLAKDVGAEVDYKQGKTLLKGPFKLDADGKFSFQNEHVSLSNLKAAVDFGAAAVVYEDMLSKIAGVPMRASIVAGGDPQRLNIQELLFELWNFSGKVLGSVELKAPFPGDLQFVLKPANLAGSERLFPPLKTSPVQGELSVSGSIHGPLMEPLKARLVADSFALRRFSGVVHFERAEFVSLRGPVTIDIQGKGEFAEGQVKSAEGRGSADLSAAALVAGPLRKEEKSLFKMRFGVRNQLQSIRIEEMDLTSFIGNIGLKGKVDVGAVPVVDLNLEAKPLSLSELRIAMPAFRESIPKGVLNSRLRLNGKLEATRPWQDWPVQVTGHVDVRIPEYKMVAAVHPVAPVGSAGAPPPASGAFLPDGALTRGARVTMRVMVDQLMKEPLMIKAISSEGVYGGGKFTGMVNIGQVFGGSVQLKNLVVPLLQEKPKIQGSVNWLSLNIEEALAFAKPELKGFAVGRTAGVAEFATVLPEQPDFMTQLKVRGDVQAQPVVFNSVKIGEAVNAQIAKVPQLKLKPMKVDPLKGMAKAQFDLNNGVAEIASFQGVDVDNSEIQMKGKVVLASLDGDLAGTFYWSNSPVRGCALEGNADAKGRLIVPVAIKGNLMQPGVNLLSDVIGKLGAKALECEGKKLVEKVKADGKEKLEKELKKTLGNLLGK